MTRTRFVLCGKNDAAVHCLETILASGDEIAAVYATRGDTGEDGWQRSLAGTARLHAIPVIGHGINTPEGIRALEAAKPDVLLSVQYDRILKPRAIAAARAALNLHYALLPRNRGCAPIAWAVLQGDPETGVTLHELDAGIDTGAIVAQRRVPIDSLDSARDVYDKCTSAAMKLYATWHPRVRTGDLPRTPQDGRQATYHPKDELDFSKRSVDTNRPTLNVYRHVRALQFPPYQWPLIERDGRTLEIYALGIAGDPRFGQHGLHVPTADGALVITKAAVDGRILNADDLIQYFSL
jgi:methionyl-tRNA formyltransferase